MSNQKNPIICVCHSGLDPESGDFGLREAHERHWIPAFAGMTVSDVFGKIAAT